MYVESNKSLFFPFYWLFYFFINSCIFDLVFNLNLFGLFDLFIFNFCKFFPFLSLRLFFVFDFFSFLNLKLTFVPFIENYSILRSSLNEKVLLGFLNFLLVLFLESDLNFYRLALVSLN